MVAKQTRIKMTKGGRSSGLPRKDVVAGFGLGLAIAIAFMTFTRSPGAAVPLILELDTEMEGAGAVESKLTSNTEADLSTATTTIKKEEPDVIIKVANTQTETAQKASSTSQSTFVKRTTPKASSTSQSTFVKSDGRRDFKAIALAMGTDKAMGNHLIADCVADNNKCSGANKHCEKKECRVLTGHFYDRIYNRWLGDNSTDDAEPFQFLEIGHYKGKGFETYKAFLPRAETHSIEISCIEPGPREEGKWPWGNFPSNNKNYQHFLDTNQLHCGDGSDYNFLHKVWTQNMKRPDAPPLKVVVEDAAHIDEHMAMSLFFWFPRIEPGGILVVEDVQPISEANKFRTHVLPQVLKDLHYCGNDKELKDKACFPTIWPLLEGVHCELHICVFHRNEEPAVEYDQELSSPPPNALNAANCLFRSSQ